ncbi:MAG: NTP transferase domain-containing protein, partial [Nitrospinae bacterium]|nr:NTP transferase domain-containing protein [Nitrospinota bacterium]
HLLSGKPLLSYVINLARGLNPDRIVVVIGHRAEKVMEGARGKGIGASERIEFVEQKEQLGTGHAVSQTEDALRDFHGNLLILSGDVPLLRIKTVRRLIKIHTDSNASVTVLTAKVDNPAGYGRIVRDSTGRVVNIIEEKDASQEIKKISEINSGIYCFKKDFLFDSLKRIDKNNIQKEYYLTDVVSIAFKTSLKIETLTAKDPHEIMGINTQGELRIAEELMQNADCKF